MFICILIILFLGDIEGNLDTSAIGTAMLCLFMDKLFDSVNGSTVNPPIGKELRCAVTKTSPHWEF